jgi:hypothetical protein
MSIVIYPTASAAMAWSAYVAWTGKQTWAARAWTTVLGFSALALLHIAFIHHLMSFRTRY